jgi:hypothetical protein
MYMYVHVLWVVQVREIEPTTLTKNYFFGEYSIYDTSFVSIPGRRFSFTKQSAATDLFITYTDTFGWNMPGGGGDSGDYRLLVDGGAQYSNRVYAQDYYGWYMMPFNFIWYFQSVAAGTHTLDMQTVRYSQSTNMLCGWPGGDTNNYFVCDSTEAPSCSVLILSVQNHTRSSSRTVSSLLLYRESYYYNYYYLYT